MCSLICNHENQCEGHCVLGRKGAPVRFSLIEQYISSTYATKMPSGSSPSNGMKVAVAFSKRVAEAMDEYIQSLPKE